MEKGKREDWEEANWKKKLYTIKVDGVESVIIPDMVIYALLNEACKKYRIAPPTAIGKTWTSYFKSSVLVADHAILDNVVVEPFGCMVNGNPSSAKKSSRVYKVKPLIKRGWSATISLVDSEEYLNAGIMKDIMEVAGKFVGIGDWRPRLGRFKVNKVEVV